MAEKITDKGKSKVNESSLEVDSVLAHESREASSSLSHPLQASSSRTNRPLFRIRRTELGLVRVDLRNMVEKNQSGYITTLDVYSNDPWLLDHVHNDMFRRNEWFYFCPRSQRSGTTSNRTVRGRGTWKSTTKKEPIRDKENKVEGYKQNLVYHKKVKGELEKNGCGWLMTEYCLHDKIHDGLVLCYIRCKIEEEVNDGFVEPVPDVGNNILSIQVQDEETRLTAGVNRSEMTMQQIDHGDATPTQQQQQQEQDTPILDVPPCEGQVLGLETTMVTTQTTGNNFMTTSHQDQNQVDGFGLGLTGGVNHGEATQQQEQQEQDTPVRSPLPREGQDSGFETTQNNDNNIMTTSHQYQNKLGDLYSYFDFAGANDDTVNNDFY